MVIFKAIKFLLLAAFAVWFVLFSYQNHSLVELSLYPFPYEIALPKFLFAILSFLAGVVVAAIAVNLKNSHERSLFKKQGKKLQAMEEEIQMTRAKQSALPATQPNQS